MMMTGFFGIVFYAGANSFLEAWGITVVGIYVIGPTLITSTLPVTVGVMGFNWSILSAGAV